MMKLVVLSCVLAAATAQFFPAAPWAFRSALAPWAYAGYLQPSNYRGPLSLAPGQSADVLGADGRPLDTLDVNLDRAAHFTAKAFEGTHLLKKRSAPIIAPYAASFVTPYAAPLAYAAYGAQYLQPYNYRGPLSLAPGQPANILGADGRPLDTLDVNLDRSAHFAAKLSGAHLLKKRSAPIIAPVAPIAPIAPIAVARTPLIAPAYTAYSSPVFSSPFTYANRYLPYAHYL